MRRGKGTDFDPTEILGEKKISKTVWDTRNLDKILEPREKHSRTFH